MNITMTEWDHKYMRLMKTLYATWRLENAAYLTWMLETTLWDFSFIHSYDHIYNVELLRGYFIMQRHWRLIFENEI